MKCLQLVGLLMLISVSPTSFAATIVGPWVPKFKGIDFSVSTNTPGGDFPRLQVVYAFRVDLTDPDIKLFTTPRRSPYVEGSQEVGGLTVSDFVKTYGVQAAINANFFNDHGSYYHPAFYPTDIYGLAISQGTVVSPPDDARRATALLFDSNNIPRITYTNDPPPDTTDIFSAIAGDFPLLIDGQVVVQRNTGDIAPRTAFGLSQDRRFLYLVGIDGRQPGYSNGAYDDETARWLLLLGAYDAVNMDGGGSTTLVIGSSTGKPIRLNKPSAVADSGQERNIASHFGIFAKPLPGFINDITVLPDDTTAAISWTTLEPATSRLEFGITELLGSVTNESAGSETAHSVRLDGLMPGTQYYFHVIANTTSSQYISPTYVFTTTNYFATNMVVEIINPWRYTSEAQENSDWIGKDYDDSNWSGPGPALLWADSHGPNEFVQPLNTEMDLDRSTGYPYVTYYFRSHFTATNIDKLKSIFLSAYVDDGLVVYLNGSEIWRLRVPFGSGANSLASGRGCDGDATCAENKILSGVVLANLIEGENVLAVEVHNERRTSLDVTFGLALGLIHPITKISPELRIESSGESVLLRWDPPDFHVQSAAAAEGPWVNEALGSPTTISPGEAQRFYRLAR
jgi:hypothetical protein